jgi:HPt (histidine-containing phosphotransfer) domain-containing protein
MDADKSSREKRRTGASSATRLQHMAVLNFQVSRGFAQEQLVFRTRALPLLNEEKKYIIIKRKSPAATKICFMGGKKERQGAPIMDKAQTTAMLIGLSVEGMDFEKGIKRFNNNPDTYIKILKSFIKSMPASLDKLRDITAENLADYAILIHGLKGSCYGVNADVAGKLAENLEHAAKAGELERVRTENGGFIAGIEELLPRLTTVIAQVEAAQGALQKKPAPDRELLAKLLAASEDFDAEGMQRAINELGKFDYEKDADLINWLKEQIVNFAYEAVEEKLSAYLAG